MIKFIVKGVIFLLIILIFQSAAYYFVPHESFQPKEVSQIKSYLKKNVEVIYLGDSTATSYSPQDKNKSSIQEFLAQDQEKYEIGAITHPAYMMDTFEKYVGYTVKHNQAVKLVIITINLRSFSTEIEENPMNEFRKAKLYLDYPALLLNIFYQPMSAFKVYQVGEADTSSNPNDTMIQQLKIRYMYDLNSNQKGVKALVKIKEDLKGTGVKALFYITPIDYQAASQYIGKDFEKKVSQNISTIKETLVAPNIDVLDLSFSLNHESFHWPWIYMNEHLKEDGRKYVAQQLVNYIENNHNKN